MAVLNAMRRKDSAHIDARSSAPNPRLNEVAGNVLFQDPLQAIPDIAHPHRADHCLGLRWPIATDQTDTLVEDSIRPGAGRRIASKSSGKSVFEKIQIKDAHRLRHLLSSPRAALSARPGGVVHPVF